MGKIKSKKKMIIGIVIAAIAIIGFASSQTVFKKGDQSVFVDVMTVEKGKITITVPANGMLEEVEKHKIFNEDNVKVLSVEVEEGDYVKKGQLLALLDVSSLNHQLEMEKNKLLIGQIDLKKLKNTKKQVDDERNRTTEQSLRLLEDAEKNLKRDETLLQEGAIAREAYEASERAYQDALSTYEENKNKTDNTDLEIEIANKNLELTALEIAELNRKMQDQDVRIISPIEGVVTSCNLQEGTFVSTSTPSFIVSDIENLQIEINVSEYDMPKVEVGHQVEIETDSLPGKVFEGVVEKIAPIASQLSSGQSTETVIPVTISVKEVDEKLKPGYSVKTRIISEEKEDTIIVPFDAVLKDENGKQFVFVVQDNIIHKVEVEIGIESDFEMEIVNGLEVGQQIVTNPSMNLMEGMAVTIGESR